MKPRPNSDTRMKKFLANRVTGALVNRTTKGVFQRPLRSVFSTGNSNSNIPRWG